MAEKKMTHWLYPANTKYYDVLGALAEEETFWPMNTKVETGDVVLIYLAAPYKQIGFLCEVAGTGFTSDMVMPYVRSFIKGSPSQEKAAKPFMKLRPTLSIPLDKESPLGLSHLKAHGMTGMLMGPRKLDSNPELLDYIRDYIQRNLP